LADRTEAIRLAPKMPEAWCARGSAYFLLGNYKNAEDDLNEALLLKPDYQEARAVLAKTLMAIARAEAPKPGAKPVVAAEQPVEVIAKPVVENQPILVAVVPPIPAPAPGKPKPVTVDPKASEIHHQRGRDLTNAGNYREALVELDEAIRLQPDFALAYNARGFAYYLVRDYAHAIADYDKAIRLNPNYENAIHNRDLAISVAKARATK
jgi:tetratricopeptide (TPR) repeat protein